MEASRASGAAAALPASSSGARQLVADLVALTKPKVQSLLLLTTVTTMLVAGTPSIGLIVATCIGGYLSAGGAGAVNHWFDRDIDAQMARTATRPIPAGRIAPRTALWFGMFLVLMVVTQVALSRSGAMRAVFAPPPRPVAGAGQPA